jgi:hypothetical protein
MQNQMAPGGRFPGTAETLATPVGSDKPVRVKIGQADNRHLQLSKKEFRARSAQQRAIDALMDANPDPTQEPQLGTNPSAATKNMTQATLPTSSPSKPAPKRRSRPKGAKGKAPKPAVPKDQPIGGPYPATSPTPVQVPAPTPTDPAVFMEERMERLERGMDKIVAAIAAIHNEKARAPQFSNYGGAYSPDLDADQALADQLIEDDDEELPDPDADDCDDELDEAREPGESCDAPPLEVAGRVDGLSNGIELEPGLLALQQMIVKRRPDKAFRFQWAGLTRAAQYNEWLPKRREAFDTLFNSIVAHPKFIHQMATFMRGSRSGQCIGNEQIARVCGMVAGFLTVYQLAAAGR